MKQCTACGQVKELEDFHRWSRSADARRSQCKECRRAQDAAAYRVDIEASRARGRERAARQQAENPEAVRARTRAWRNANRDKVAAYDRRQRELYPERLQARFRAWAEANPEANRERARAWSQANPTKVVDHVMRRRYRKLAAWVEDVEREVVWVRDEGRCRLCGLPAFLGDWHLEHLTPLTRGGEHSYVNTAVAHPACNLRKGRLTLVEFWEREARRG